MNTERNDYFDFIEDENPVQIKQVIGQYLRYWPWFIGTIVLCLFIASLYLRYADVIYKTEAKVKILSDKENANFSLDVSKLFNKSSINLENEIALFKSVHLSESVVQNLELNVAYIYNSTVTSKNTFNPPFVLTYLNSTKTPLQSQVQYSITISKTGYTIVNVVTGKTNLTKGYIVDLGMSPFPIKIRPSKPNIMTSNIDKNFSVIISPIRKIAKQLSNSISIVPDADESDILSLSIQGTDGSHSEKILNNLISVFENDGITDKQEISQRTIRFVEDRFVYLRRELDSIEISKKEYKKRNNLSFINEDAGSSLLEKNEKDKASYEIESQLLLVKLLKNNVSSQKVFELLPADIGIQNSAVNGLVSEYNSSVFTYQKLLTSAGANNPSIQNLVSGLIKQKANILNSVDGYTRQLKTTLNKSESAQRNAEGSFSSLPEKEKVLRSIERQQNLKESLYLLLLQKKEEASINVAVTVPNTKIIDYAITNNAPVSPQRTKIYLVAFLLGLVFPLGILFLVFKLDNKIHNATDVENQTRLIPILAELPSLSDTKDSISQSLEAFRTLAYNTNFITPVLENKEGSILFVASSIKGEGKTFVSYNLAKAYSQLEKKVIIVGADFRNPQLHKYLDQSRKGYKGLSNYLHDPALEWQDLICKTVDDKYPFDILLSGDIPPNPTLLLSNQRFASFVDELKKRYDIIVFDTAPTLLVTDSLIISKYATTTLYVLRSGVTEKKLVSYSSKLGFDKKINNMGFVINDIDFNSAYGYGYGYNYGYRYGYGKEIEKMVWYKRWI
ncbi:GumC family protein [Flavobacterium cellulosilyticum]|uniref:non-specific protein-tyrosine kinase n=1 Tax=Flavobacterium cellulosilyticum TaxID=2541731 RepID=A0A4V2YYZ8_9FLAO|nr:tyrosine-protein kinase family protein [Flavobacterium cellulosilyticum]TDD95077.1 polysaccharide biosynthesis tyrosine autokinase [Flavobacterium cellulosilyticum]